jgi:DNA modification methylase
MAAMEPSSINLICTSPPYNLGKDYGGTCNDRLSVADYTTMTRGWLTQAARILHPTGSLWINVGHMKNPRGGIIPLEFIIYPIAMDLGFTFIQFVTWNKRAGMPQPHRFSHRCERWLWFTKTPKARTDKNPQGYVFNLDDVRMEYRLDANGRPLDKRNSPLGRNPTDLWDDFPGYVHNAKARPDHPCPFLVKLIERIVKACSDPGQVVLDPFGGVGSTAIAADRLGRHFISIEINPTYHSRAVHRYLNQGTPSVQQANQSEEDGSCSGRGSSPFAEDRLEAEF